MGQHPELIRGPKVGGGTSNILVRCSHLFCCADRTSHSVCFLPHSAELVDGTHSFACALRLYSVLRGLQVSFPSWAQREKQLEGH